MSHKTLAAALIAALGTIGTAASAQSIDIMLSGYQEVPQALSTPGTGRFKAKVDESAGTIEYELSYADLIGTATQAHIHFGRRGVAGGIMVWLCQSPTNVDPTGLSPQCPAAGGTVTGTLQAASVVGPAAQGIDPGEFAEVVAALRAGAGYVNVHSSKFPPGEIRGQVGARSGREGRHHHH